MAIHVALHHRTHYYYDRLVAHSPHVIRLRPAPHCRTPILSYSQKILPKEHFINWQQDPFSNYLARVVFNKPSAELLVEIDLVVEMAVYNPFDFFLEDSAQKFPFLYSPELKKQLDPFLPLGPRTPLLAAFVDSVPKEAVRTIDYVVALNQRLWKDIKYLIRLEPGVQTPEETLRLGSGSCRDSAWLLVNAFRHLGLAARFVSGYLIQLKPDVKSLDGPSGTEIDFTDLHAWAEVYLPGAGWVGLDPTSGLLAGEGHIPLACAPEPTSAAPIEGGTDKCEVRFSHEMKVTRIYESPRVTKPYTEEQWLKIDELGGQVDEELEKNDTRLTMGGEPTFISIDNMDGEEWNFAALGPEKRALADKLVRRLKGHFAPGGLLHYGQGKWYPGESLPRWAFGCHWRRDGQPIWRDPSLFGSEDQNYGHNEQDASRFIQLLGRILGVKTDHILPAFEDALYYMWRERRLPPNVDPLTSHLDNAEERESIRRIFDQGLAKVIGYVLPLQKDTQSQWMTGPWFLRSERLFLLPGDSPIGYRLPLDSIPWVTKQDYPYIISPDPSLPLPSLPLPSALRTAPRRAPEPESRAEAQLRDALEFLERSQSLERARFAEGVVLGASPQFQNPEKEAAEAKKAREREASSKSGESGSDERRPAFQQSADWIIRTAVCVEPRHGRLHVFMPPVRDAEDYLDLISAVEEAATALKMPVVIEGAPPPNDARLNQIKITPDPGVIEVNLQPAANWKELVRNTTIIYDEARQSRLGAEKFMIDGRHVGSGGGNHIVLGGATPADSPVLRRPDLLRSLLNYWQNHPSLSFLFSGLFIGPTSQHPRIDEARNDSLYELELAFKQIPAAANVPPWLVDRIFRNLLVDSTGNTHRAEFCIDKLYAPESATGRLGLVEMRAFEMPPHSRMSLTQQLLLRAMIARFWKQPYSQDLVRWGVQLHDRFMLPHFVRQDFEDVIADLNESGYPIDKAWFDPHFEFRFPQYGDVTYRGVNLEIRQALEPWHVLGEQGAPGGAARYVDSSLERLQVKARGLIDSRHVIACNGVQVPLHPTGIDGEFVAGVRFRAWQPPECLHPTIGIHTPLTFDVVDMWNHRSMGGCAFHAVHPGGLSPSTLPVNAYEAESRRLARFSKIGHTPGVMAPLKIDTSPEHPLTLDLRQAGY